LRRTIEQPGQIEGIEQTPLFAKIAGYVAEWKHDIGDEVRKDDVLAVLSVPEIDEELRQKEAAVSLADASIVQAKRALDAAEANRRVADADRRHTAAVLSYATIKAPFDGVVTRRTVDVGQFVQPASGPGGAPPLFVVVRTNPVRIFVDTPEVDAPFVVRGTPA